MIETIRSRPGWLRRLLWYQRKLKTPQERSDEEAEAEPTESEVASPVGLYILFILIRLCLQSETWKPFGFHAFFAYQ
ncbi:hypothetical protein FQV26_10325 [Planococcus sp. CPCC 101016]|nr:hypothetical protein FQV26_10325 [Planococcus sp. CPCC 101016]